MENSIVFNNPLLLILLGIAMALTVFDVMKKSSGYVFPLLSVLLVLGTLTYAMLLGAALYETATVLMLFAAVNLLSFGGKELPIARAETKAEVKPNVHEEQGGSL